MSENALTVSKIDSKSKRIIGQVAINLTVYDPILAIKCEPKKHSTQRWRDDVQLVSLWVFKWLQ